MRRQSVGLIVLALLVLSCVGHPPDDASGREIYLQVCANCHGDDLGGRIGPPLGAGSNSSLQPDEFLEIAITDGRGRMPSFASTLEVEQIDRLIVYIREEQTS